MYSTLCPRHVANNEPISCTGECLWCALSAHCVRPKQVTLYDEMCLIRNVAFPVIKKGTNSPSLVPHIFNNYLPKIFLIQTEDVNTIKAHTQWAYGRGHPDTICMCFKIINLNTATLYLDWFSLENDHISLKPLLFFGTFVSPYTNWTVWVPVP